MHKIFNNIRSDVFEVRLSYIFNSSQNNVFNYNIPNQKSTY